jgi:UDP-N-acetylglucosamine/UDP-N-acetylgalactosamine 4-epimerase
MNILVTGGAGFIGSNIIERLLKDGHIVVCLDDLSAGFLENIEEFMENKDFTFIKGSILDIEMLSELIQEHKITHISHQAAFGSVPKSVENPLLWNEVNIGGSLNVLWAAKENGVKRVVCAISSSVYGDSPTLPKVETMPYLCKSPYAITKATCEMYCKNFFELYGLETVALRYFNVYGKKQSPTGLYPAVIPAFVSNALANKDLTIFGTGSVTRDFTYVDDVVEANVLALTTDGVAGEHFNVACGKRISIQELAEKTISIIGSSSKIIHEELRQGDVEHSLANVDKIKKMMNFSAKVDVGEGLKRTIDWFKK